MSMSCRTLESDSLISTLTTFSVMALKAARDVVLGNDAENLAVVVSDD